MGKMLVAGKHRTCESNDRAMAQAGTALQKAQVEMTAFEEGRLRL